MVTNAPPAPESRKPVNTDKAADVNTDMEWKKVD